MLMAPNRHNVDEYRRVAATLSMLAVQMGHWEWAGIQRHSTGTSLTG